LLIGLSSVNNSLKQKSTVLTDTNIHLNNGFHKKAGAEILEKICAASASRENTMRAAGRTLLGIYSVLAAGVARSLSLGMIRPPSSHVE
jgi:hypothetical protein